MHRDRLALGLPMHSEIRPFPQFVQNSPVKELLTKGWPPPKPESFDHFLRIPPFILRGYGETLPASPLPTHPDPTKDYHLHEWGRDFRWGLLALKWLGEKELIKKVGLGILGFYGSPEHYEALTHLHFEHHAPHWAYSQGHARQPFVRMPINEKQGTLAAVVQRANGIDNGYQWGHDQPGTFGEIIWEFFQMARQELLEPGEISHLLATKLGPRYHGHGGNPLHEESIFVTMMKTLHKICICNPGTKDHQFLLWTKGPWEERKAHNRLSEIAPIYAAAVQMYRFFRAYGWSALKINEGPHQAGKFKHDLEELVELADEAFNKRLPRRSTEMARETDTEGEQVEQLDSSAAFTLWPYDLELTWEQKIAVLKTVYHFMQPDRFQGPGIPRYRGDPYCGSRLTTHSDGNWNVSLNQPGFREQHWFLDDPILSLFFARETSESLQRGGDLRYSVTLYGYALAHNLRSNSQIPQEADSYIIRPYDGSSPFEVNIPAGIHREGAWQDADGRWRMGPNALHWTASLNTIANIRMKLATQQLWEKLISLRNGRPI